MPSVTALIASAATTTSGMLTPVAMSAALRRTGSIVGPGQRWTTGQVSVRVMPVDRLHVRDDHPAELVDRLGLDAHDDVVGSGDVLGGGDTGEVADLALRPEAALPTSVWIKYVCVDTHRCCAPIRYSPPSAHRSGVRAGAATSLRTSMRTNLVET